jgi:hypothetical protein
MSDDEIEAGGRGDPERGAHVAQYAAMVKEGYDPRHEDIEIVEGIDELVFVEDEVLEQWRKHNAVLDQMKRQLGLVPPGDPAFSEHVQRTNAFMDAHRALQPAIGADPEEGFIEPEKGPGYDTPQPGTTSYTVAAVRRRVPLKKPPRLRPREAAAPPKKRPLSYTPEIWTVAAKKVP